ncbi:MAG: hypothetical protein ACTINM_03465 [Acetobacter cibinongensis]
MNRFSAMQTTKLRPTLCSLAAHRALRQHGATSLSDLQFMEQWASGGTGASAASILRAGQIRRTNPDLMQDIAQSVSGNPQLSRHKSC